MTLITSNVSEAGRKGVTTETHPSYATDDALIVIQGKPFPLISYKSYDIKQIFVTFLGTYRKERLYQKS